MNLKENLKKIRKDNNLSQEDLAEKLGVSRQAVSKWESGTAYPEMDKVIQICNMFGLNIDDLLNQNITEIERKNNSKINPVKYLEDFIDFFTKTIRMLGSMKFKDRIKCLLEQVVVFMLLFTLFAIIEELFANTFGRMLYLLPETVIFILTTVLKSIYCFISLIVGIFILVKVFKTRYLNYYVIVDSHKDEEVKEEIVNEKETKYVEEKKEKIIIRDPKHSEYKFLDGILKGIVFLIKCFVFIILMMFCASFVFLIALVILNFLIYKIKLLFIGLLLAFLSCIIINFVILNVLYNFIISRKSKKVLLGILVLISMVLLGIGSAISLIACKDFKVIDEYDKYLVTTTETIEMKDNLMVDILNLKYIESNNNDLKFVIKSLDRDGFKTGGYRYGEFKDDYIYYIEYANAIDYMKIILKSLNNKELLENYDYYEVELYTSKKNIEILKKNNSHLYD